MSSINYTKYIGIPYESGGRDFSKIDCYGLILLLYKEIFDIILPDFQKEEYKGEFSNLWSEISKDNLKEGDVVLFRRDKNISSINHIGMYIDNNKMIHCFDSGVSIDRINRPYFESLYYKAFRYKK